ncbi:MAG TPA: trypsin-like serine protease [Dehalococcoidia bacterium]|nr:trypsin-like serine protease [Dehalococcoidia bacterium]
MTTLLPQLNNDLGELADRVSESLVQVHIGHGGSGSGVVLSEDRLIVTNAHVVSGRRGQTSGGKEIRVVLPDGSETAAKLLAKDDEQDVAILQVEKPAEDNLALSPIQIGDSKGLRAGQWVMAMGHRWGVPGVAAAGIVIGAGPDLPESPGTGKEWIAVDLALTPGHSGGPLVDHQGQLVGMSTMMAGLEVGLAVPVHVIEQILAEVKANAPGDSSPDMEFA